MGKKDKTGLGRALIKKRFSKKGPRNNNDSMLHTAELDDGYDFNKINLKSVTEESSFAEFLSIAELAGTEFQAEKLNISVVTTKNLVGVPTTADIDNYNKNRLDKKELLRIPRRPPWDSTTSTEELQSAERESFLNWRRNLAQQEEKDPSLILTPFEKNLEFWRQLWRVVERSDILVQIVDARNPLLFRCEDLEEYVKEVNPEKRNLLLVNKSDFLTEKQRQIWSDYFQKEGIEAVFYSALQEKSDDDSNDDDTDGSDADDISDRGSLCSELTDSDKSEYFSADDDEPKTNPKPKPSLLDRQQLVEYFESFKPSNPVTPGITTVGLVGYPNVGKSSTINSLLAVKKVPVSATPGKTKHFQTLRLTHDVMLCDCPGLVFPSFVITKGDMVLNGILPVDQLRDHVSPINLLTRRIPRRALEEKYSIMMRVNELKQSDFPTAEEFLNAYAYSRGFMTQNGQPDNSRAARVILKDYVSGRLLYATAPPDLEQSEFHTFETVDCLTVSEAKHIAKPTPQAWRAIASSSIAGGQKAASDVDERFFQKSTTGAHVKGGAKMVGGGDADQGTSKGGKPWKNHSEKRNKKEKLRRIYRHLDEV